MPFVVMMSFRPKSDKPDWESTGMIFETGAEANDYCKAENQYNTLWGTPTRFRVRAIPMEDPLAWRFREQAKLDSGELKRPPWSDMGTDLYEHIDPDHPGRIRFFQTEQDAWRGKYTSMNPGKFIKTYLDPYILDTQIDEWCAQMGLDMAVSKLKIARSVDEIVEVYTTGPHSCMSYKKGTDTPFYIRNYHPVEPYGESDLGVAYITRCDDITGRCLVWPDKKIHGRIYGDTARMTERLKEEGYVENWDGFVGAKLRLIRTTKNRIVVPYFDGECGAVIEGDHLVISDKPHLILKSPYGVPEADACTRCSAKNVHLVIVRDSDGEMVDFVCAEGCSN